MSTVPPSLFGLLTQSNNFVWDVNLLEWVAMTQPTGGGGGTVNQGTAGVDPWLVTGTVTIDAGLLATAAKQDTGNTSLASIDGKLTNPLPVSGSVTTGGLTDTQLRATAVPISGSVTTGGLTDTQLRATAVPISLATAPSTPVTNANLDVALSTLATQTTLVLLESDAHALTTAQQASATAVVGPLVQSRVDAVAPGYLDQSIAPLSMSLQARVRTLTDSEEMASAWDEDEDTGWNQHPSAMNFETTNQLTIDTVWES